MAPASSEDGRFAMVVGELAVHAFLRASTFCFSATSPGGSVSMLCSWVCTVGNVFVSVHVRLHRQVALRLVPITGSLVYTATRVSLSLVSFSLGYSGAEEFALRGGLRHLSSLLLLLLFSALPWGRLRGGWSSSRLSQDQFLPL